MRFVRRARIAERGILVQAARAGGEGILQEVHGETRVGRGRSDARRRGGGGGIRRDIAREHAGRVSTASERRGGSLAGRPRGDEEGLDARPDQLVIGHDAAARQNHGIDSQLALQRERRLRRGGEGRGGEDLLLGVHNYDTTRAEVVSD